MLFVFLLKVVFMLGYLCNNVFYLYVYNYISKFFFVWNVLSENKGNKKLKMICYLMLIIGLIELC